MTEAGMVDSDEKSIEVSLFRIYLRTHSLYDSLNMHICVHTHTYTHTHAHTNTCMYAGI